MIPTPVDRRGSVSHPRRTVIFVAAKDPSARPRHRVLAPEPGRADAATAASSAARPRHPQVRLTVDGFTVEVDELLAPLIEGLWLLGIRTRFSCQSVTRKLNLVREPREWFYVMFADAEDLRRMMALFVGTPLDPTLRTSSWRYELYPEFRDSTDDLSTVGLHPVVLIPVEQMSQVAAVVLAFVG